MNIGDRVKVKIKDRSTYARGCAEALDGLPGVIEEASKYEADKWLVRFDKSAPTWSTYQTPPTAFWFEAAELEAA